ncbi:MAG: hypothetical protein AAF995_00850 [Planctomycetota bacterium]
MSLVIKPSRVVFWVVMTFGLMVLLGAIISSGSRSRPPLQWRTFAMVASGQNGHAVIEGGRVIEPGRLVGADRILTYYVVRVPRYYPGGYAVIESASLRVMVRWHGSRVGELGEPARAEARAALERHVAGVPGFEQIATPMRSTWRIAWRSIFAGVWFLAVLVLIIAAVAWMMACMVGFVDAVFSRLFLPKAYPVGQCSSCGYDLAGLRSAVCPECGCEVVRASEFSRSLTAR